MPRLHAHTRCAALALAGLAVLLPSRARAILDVEDRGPTLQAGAFAMRITNIGVIGNPFFDIGRSFDPSFEYPRGSGNELLKHADLWVGAVNTLGHARVSGGPLLEWRPTLDPEDRVRLAYGGLPHTRRFFDDDGDGKVDEELLNGRDDDGDGQVDEDLGISAAQMAAAEYTDDQPAAVAYAYPNGETHEPLHLHVRQEAYAWSVPGYDRVAGLQFVITNIGSETLHDLWVGLFTDLDSRGPGDAGGHLNDRLTSRSYSRTFNDGFSRVPTVQVGNPPGPYFQTCINTDSGTWPVVTDGLPGSGLPAAAVMGLSHSLDPIAQMVKNGLVPPSALPFTYAPAQRQFRWSVYANDEPPGQGGPPILDADRYRALTGDYPGVTDTLQAHDYVVLVSCGPFPVVAPGRSIEVNFALVAGQNADSVAEAMGFAADVHHGAWVNEVPDTVLSARGDWDAGRSGITGHEACVEPA